MSEAQKAITKLNVQINKDLLAAFNEIASRLNLRRDSYLEQAIRHHLATETGKNKFSTPHGLRISKSLRRLAPQEAFERVRIAVSPALVDDLNTFCDSRWVLRDEFLELVIERSVEHLGWVEQVLGDLDYRKDVDHFEALYWAGDAGIDLRRSIKGLIREETTRSVQEG